MSERARLWLIVAVAMMLIPAHAVAADEQKQVLVVYSTRRDTQVAIVGDRELPRVLEAGLSRKLDYYSDTSMVRGSPTRNTGRPSTTTSS